MTEPTARVGIYLDLDTMVPHWGLSRGFSTNSFFSADTARVYIGQIEQYAARFGEVIVREAVGDWTSRSRGATATLLYRDYPGTVLRHMPPFLPSENGQNESAGKNAADILIAARVIRAVYADRLNVVVLGATDKDFEPLAQELKRLGVTVVAVGPALRRQSKFQKALLTNTFDGWHPLELPAAWVAAEGGDATATAYLEQLDQVAAQLASREAEPRPREPDDGKADLLPVAVALFDLFAVPRERDMLVEPLGRVWPVAPSNGIDAIEYHRLLITRFVDKMSSEGSLVEDGDTLSISQESPAEEWVWQAVNKLRGAEALVFGQTLDVPEGLDPEIWPKERQRRSQAHVNEIFAPVTREATELRIAALALQATTDVP